MQEITGVFSRVTEVKAKGFPVKVRFLFPMNAAVSFSVKNRLRRCSFSSGKSGFFSGVNGSLR